MVKEKKWWSGWPVNQIDTDKVSEATKIKKAAQGSTQAGRSNGDRTVISVHEDDQPWRLDPRRFSNWTKLIRVQAWAEEIEDAAIQVIKGAQRKGYPDEYSALQRLRELPKKSKLLGLQPWLDEEGQMRCDGRLKYAEFLPQDARFPIILPRKNCVTKLIVKYYHEKDNHAGGTNQLLAALSTCFWIISGREEIREWEKECNECQRRKAKAAKQIMAPLPQMRLRFPLRAFAQSAVDYGGPFITVQGRRTR
ncbi:uncharacterized protein [Montipora foliosa]|uniref:uncharacterized protein n=1 Tax=Montipora foliosa TaxID=591990 RepID=UPI0035F1973D